MIARCTAYFLLFLVSPCLCFVSHAQEPLRKIGVILPLSGRIAIVGETLRNVMQLAKEEQTKSSASFIFEDDQWNPKNSVIAAQKLIRFDKVDGLVVFGSGPSLAVLDIAHRANVPLIAIAFAEKIVEGEANVIRWSATAAQQMVEIVKELRQRNYKRLAIITTTTEVTFAMREELRQEKIPTVLDLEVLSEDSDLRSAAAKIREANADGVFMLLAAPQYAILSQRLREQRVSADFFSGSFLDNQAEIDAANGALNGSWFVGTNVCEESPLYQKYLKRFGHAPNADAILGYDLAVLLLSFSSKAEWIEVLAKKDYFNGVLGTFKKLYKRTFVPPLALKKIVAGKIVIARPL